METKRRQLWADLLLLLVTLIWGSTFVMVKDATASYPIFPFLTLRFGLAALALLLIGWRRLPSLGWKGVGAGVLIGLFLFSGYALQTFGLRYTSASKAGFITGLSVVIVPVLSTLLLRRRPTPGAFIGVCLATVGLALLTLDHDRSIAIGDLLVLGCALSFALHIVAVSAFAPRMDPLALTIIQVATVTLASGTITLFTDRPWPQPGPSAWLAAGFTGVLATAVAFFAQTAMQRFTTPTHTALIFAGEPVFAALFGVLLAGDVITARGLAGGILIITGTVVSELRWSERTAKIISRFLSPHYIAGPLLLTLALGDSTPWAWGLLWATGIGLLSVVAPLLILKRELRRGGISDWYISNRKERLRPIPVLLSLVVALAPLVLLVAFHGPRLMLVGAVSALILVVFNLMITLGWKISQHVSSIAASATLITAALGIGAAPVLLLIPLVAWARVKIGAHTVMQTVAGGVAGTTITLAALRFCGVV
jgi:drug/metabolite transporter (DMT)-like permease/membrane-associated phospholipid phosphatase